MSADNYVTVKERDGLYYPAHGFMSDLESGIPAFVKEGTPAYTDWLTAANAAHRLVDSSEYGLIDEPEGFSKVLTREEAITYYEDKIQMLKGMG